MNIDGNFLDVVIEKKSEEQIHFVYVGYVREDRGIYKIFNAVKEVTDRGYNIYMDIYAQRRFSI